jgi:hypothetical protein
MSLNYNNIIENAKIICICYKWGDSEKIYSLTWDKNQCDKQMLKDFLKIMNQADEIVGHNSDKFDTRWIRTRCLFHDIDMFPNYTSVDTLKAARSGFNFPSNRLDSIGRYTGMGKKIKTTEELWFDVWRKNCKKSLKGMVEYCKQDVILLENVFNKLNKYIKPKSSIADNRCECPECGSDDMINSSRRKMATGSISIQLRCKNCGKMTSVPERTFLNYKKVVAKRELLIKQLKGELGKLDL